MARGGTAKKKIESVRATESIYRLIFDKKFQKDVKELRLKSGIPSVGFKSELEETHYYRTVQGVPGPTLLFAIELLKKHGLPPAYYWEMGQYLRFNRLETERNSEEEMIGIKFPNNQKDTTAQESSLESLGQPYVGIYILDASSKEKITALIHDNWDAIRRSLQAQGGNTAKITPAKNKHRNVLILELLGTSSEVLRKQYGYSGSMTKEILVAKIMRERFGYKSITPDLVKKFGNTKIYKRQPTDKPRQKRRYIEKKK